MSLESNNVIQLRPRSDAPVQPLPSSVRPAMDLAREDDRRQQERIKELAREARRVFDKSAVDPSLKLAIAHEIAGLVHALEGLSARAKACGLLSTAACLTEHAGLLEAESALVEAEAGQ